MNDAIYFAKVQYDEYLGYSGHPHMRILLDLVNRELLYQEFKWTRRMPAIQKTEVLQFGSILESVDYGVPAKIVRSGKNNFNGKLLENEQFACEVVFAWGHKLSEEELVELLPYCNALDFEPYRDKKMSMNDEGYIGYRDEISTHFTGITDSHLPKLELPMNYYYDEEHIWPSEKLYRYLVYKYLEGNKKLKNRGVTYGGCSLFWG